LILACAAGAGASQADQARTPPPAGGAQETALSPESAALERERYVKEVMQGIAGREQEPAGSVFKNVQVFKGMPAGRMLRIMEMGFGRSLGVSCTHCHVAGEWEKEDKPAKQIAREMWAMAQTITSEYLSKIKNLHSERPTVNCTTCHRGQVKPALELGQPGN